MDKSAESAVKVTEVEDVRPAKTVHIEVKIPERQADGTFRQRTLEGDFTIRRMTIGDVGRCGTELARLNGGVPETAMDESALAINTMVAHFKFSIVKAPSWFKLDEIYNLEILNAVFAEVMAFQSSFRPPESKQLP